MLDIAFIDHYDSFSFNLVSWLRQGLGNVLISHYYFDDPDLCEALRPECAIVLSPGPGHPADQHATRALVAQSLGHVPILGVCLGHQILGLEAGLEVGGAREPFHGAVRTISLREGSCLAGWMPDCFAAATYNSLALRAAGVLRPHWRIGAYCEHQDIQVLEYNPPHGSPALGVQFHPESFQSLSQEGLLARWRDMITA
jgi:anthranilate synthase/aminodeoxychorismate synthase-like glutamine amidotransferase